jgi:hypothetical protein
MTDDDDESESTGAGHPAGTAALVAYLEARYGDRFDDERRGKLADAVAEVREEGETLRASSLDNAEGPAFAFEPYRGEGE